MLQTKPTNYHDGRVDYDYSVILNLFKKMEKSIKLWQAVVATLVLMITIVSAIINQSNKIETQRLRIEFLETNAKDQSLQIRDLNQQQAQQYKEINAKLTDILVNLQNKENKK